MFTCPRVVKFGNRNDPTKPKALYLQCLFEVSYLKRWEELSLNFKWVYVYMWKCLLIHISCITMSAQLSGIKSFCWSWHYWLNESSHCSSFKPTHCWTFPIALYSYGYTQCDCDYKLLCSCCLLPGLQWMWRPVVPVVNVPICKCAESSHSTLCYYHQTLKQ